MSSSTATLADATLTRHCEDLGGESFVLEELPREGEDRMLTQLTRLESDAREDGHACLWGVTGASIVQTGRQCSRA